MKKHKHAPFTYAMDPKFSGYCDAEGHDHYVYAYRLTCRCGASRVQTFDSAAEAQAMTDLWDRQGVKADTWRH